MTRWWIELFSEIEILYLRLIPVSSFSYQVVYMISSIWEYYGWKTWWVGPNCLEPFIESCFDLSFSFLFRKLLSEDREEKGSPRHSWSDDGVGEASSTLIFSSPREMLLLSPQHSFSSSPSPLLPVESERDRTYSPSAGDWEQACFSSSNLWKGSLKTNFSLSSFSAVHSTRVPQSLICR